MRYSVCSELFGPLNFATAARLTAEQGFTGIEISPGDYFGSFTPGEIQAGVKMIRQALSDTGLSYAGMHRLLSRPEGLQPASADPAERRRAWEHINLLIDISRDLGGGNLVLGSPKRRSAQGISAEEGMAYLGEGLTEAAERAAKNHFRLLIEPIPAHQTNLVNTMAEAEELVRLVDQSGIAAAFSFHNTVDETEPWDFLLDKYWSIIRHVHLNEMDGSWPGLGGGDFTPAFSVLHAKNFDGWVSLESFLIPEDPAAVLARTMEFIKSMKPSPAVDHKVRRATGRIDAAQ